MSSIQNKKNPTLIEVKTDELGISMLLNIYNQAQADYEKNISGGFRNEAKNDLNKLSEINARLLSLINTTKGTLENAYEKGINNQVSVSKNNTYLVEIAERLNKDEKKINEAYNELVKVETDSINSSKQRVSNLYKYVAMMILSVIVIFLTVRAYITSDSNSIETIILVLAIALIVYQVVDSYVTPLRFL